MKIGNLVASAVILVWGAAILLNSMVTGGAQGSGAYHNGQNAALVFAVVMIGAGTAGLWKELGKRAH